MAKEIKDWGSGRIIISSKIYRIGELLKRLESAGSDPHGEIDWGKDVGREVGSSRKFDKSTKE